MQRDPKDAGAAQEKFPFLVSSVMSRRILERAGADPLQSSVDQEARSSLDDTCQANLRSR